MNTLPFTEGELEDIRYALRAEAIALKGDAARFIDNPPIYEMYLERSRKYDDLALRMVQPEPIHSEWYWINLYDYASVHKVGTMGVCDVPDSIYLQDWLGPFSTEEAAQQVADAYNDDDRLPQNWWWIFTDAGGFSEYHRMDEIPEIFPATFSPGFVGCWTGPFTNEVEADGRARKLNAFAGYYDAS